MSNDYYNQTSTGGYMTGSQASPSGSPGGGAKKYGTSLRPVVCRQILDATRASGDAEVLIDGAEAHQLSLVAQVVSTNVQSTNLVLTLDDGTGQVEARQWIEAGKGDTEELMQRQGTIENEWVRVLGTIKNFANKRHFAAMVIRPVTDPHEIYFALLEALQIHVLTIRGPPNGSSMDGVQSTASAYAPSGGGPKTDPYAHLDPMQRKIIQHIVNSAVGEDGIHVTKLTKALGPGVSAEAVSDALEKLTEQGHIFNTSDEFHFALT